MVVNGFSPPLENIYIIFFHVTHRFEKMTLILFMGGNLLLATCLACLVYYFNPVDH